MAKYAFLIRVRDQQDYWHDFDFATSGEAAAQADAINLSGDSITEEDPLNPTRDIYHSYSANAIDGVHVYFPE
jgi:hypothetical protein